MKAIRVHNYGSSEQLRFEDTPIPEINDNQVLVKIYATSVNHLEIKKASGAFRDKFELKMPWIPGHDFAGVVEKVGKDVTSFNVGDKVYGNANDGYVLRDMDLVLVFTGGDVQEKSYKVLKKGGRLVSITGPIIEDLAKEHEVLGVFMVIKQSAKDLQEITKLIESGDVKTDIGLTYKLEEAAIAWETVLGTNPELPKIAHGKVVLEVNTK